MPVETTTVASRLGCKLRAALTDEQIQTLLDVVGEAGYLDAVAERLRVSDPDLAEAVRRILASPSSQSAQAPSAGKTLEIWLERWSAWTGCIAKVGQKEGPYRESALWMKALSEVNTVGYENLLARWKSEFRRRRNLWQDMAAVGCPGKYG